MKLSLVLLTVALSVATAATRSVRSPKAMARLIQNARRLEDEDNADEEEQEEYAFLQDYTLKFVSCKAGEKFTNPENGEYEYNAVVFRLCPNDSCDSDVTKGCKSGYGDFVVGLNTFVDAYFEDQRENMQGDDAFDLAEYAECREYKAEEEEDDEGRRRRRLDEVQYFVGPACTEDGTDVKLEMYTDENCAYVSEDVSFYDYAGSSLPYEDGGVVNTNCMECYGKNDNGEYEVREMCMDLYEFSSKCETNMESYSDYGKNENGCEYIEELTYEQKSGAGAAFFWILIVVLAIGGVGAFFWVQRNKKRATQAESSVNSTGLMS